MGPWTRIATRLEAWITNILTRLLTRPLRGYEQRVPNSLARMKEQLHKGDVILVEGDQRVSQVIKYLTTSSWSHTALYIGDELRRHDPALAQELDRRFGSEARHLIIEADNPGGVTCAPVAKYMRYNIRVCRPRLRRGDVDRIIDFAFSHLGRKYNVRHIFDLAKYFFPVSIIPRRFRQTVLHSGSEERSEIICSTLIARAFGSVGYPVLPKVTVDEIKAQTSRWRRWIGGGSAVRALYEEADPAFITPRDFDLSPYFDIVKINYVTEPGFDYRQIEWTLPQKAMPAPAHGETKPPSDASPQGQPEPKPEPVAADARESATANA